MALTEVAIKAVLPKDRPFKVADGGGLHLLVTPAGGKLWRFKYRIDGREKLLSIGTHPLISLKAAREVRDEAKRALAQGNDPSAAKRDKRKPKEEVKEDVATFEIIASELLLKMEREGRAAATMEKTRWLLGYAFTDFGSRPIKELNAQTVLSCLRRLEERGRHESAQRLRSVIGSVFRYAVATARADVDPTFALRGALTRPTVQSRPAVTEPVAFGALLRAIWHYNGYAEVRAALKLMAILYPRPGELRLACWSEFDMEKRVWTIPATRAKMRRVQRVPLPDAALAILSDLKGISRSKSLVFPSLRSSGRPISENTLNSALRVLGYSKDEATAHGFRASFSTIANESGLWHPDAIERALGHVEQSDVRRAYARGEHWEERQRMAAWWADLIEQMRNGQNRSTLSVDG